MCVYLYIALCGQKVCVSLFYSWVEIKNKKHFLKTLTGILHLKIAHEYLIMMMMHDDANKYMNYSYDMTALRNTCKLIEGCVTKL